MEVRSALLSGKLSSQFFFNAKKQGFSSSEFLYIHLSPTARSALKSPRAGLFLKRDDAKKVQLRRVYCLTLVMTGSAPPGRTWRNLSTTEGATDLWLVVVVGAGDG